MKVTCRVASLRASRDISTGLLVSASVLATPVMVHAQDARSGAATADPAGAVQSANPVPSSTALGEVVVTANRTESVASKTPVSLSVVTRNDLRDKGVTDATGLANAASNLAVDRVAGGGVQLTIRGVSSSDNSEKGDPSAAFLSDGIYIARPQAQEVSLFDIERVEVLRGPQGTLYGRNTTAGLINVISARPRNTFQASADVAYGNYNTLQTTAMVNVPLNDAAAVRAAFNYNGRDNYVRQGSSQPSLNPGKDDTSFRLSGKFDLSERLRLYLKGDYSSMKGNPQTGVALSNFYQMPIGAPTPGQRGVQPVYKSGQSATDLQTLGFTQASESTSDNNTWGLHGELEVNLSDNLTATYLGSYRSFTRDELGRGYVGMVYQTGGPPGSPPPGTRIPLNSTFNGEYKQQSHELRLAYRQGALNAQAGLYYFQEESDVDFLLFGTQGFQPGQRGYVYGFSQHPTNSDSTGLFGQATLRVANDLRLTAGVRNTTDNKSRVGATVNHANVSDPLDFTTGTQPGTTNPRNQRDSLNNASVRYRKTTWRLGADYDLNPTTLLYATVSTGYKAGGFNEGCVAGQPNCNTPVSPAQLYYAPETLTSYEFGVKTSFAERKGRLTAAVFHYDYKNLQVGQVSSTYAACSNACLVTSNAGKAKVDGIEFDTIYQPSAAHRFDLSATWLNARYIDFDVGSGVNFAGEKLDRSPERTASAGYLFTMPIMEGNLGLGLRIRYSDSYHFVNSSLRNFFYQPSYRKTDLTATYTAQGGKYYVQGFVKNLENKITVSSVQLSANYPAFTDGNAQFADPRTYGVRVGYRF